MDLLAPSKLESSGYPNPSPEELVDLAIESHIARVNKRSLSGDDVSFFIADLGQITRQHHLWMQNLPDIQPYYGIIVPFQTSIFSMDMHFKCIYINPLPLSLHNGRTIINKKVSGKMQLRPNPPQTPCRPRHWF